LFLLPFLIKITNFFLSSFFKKFSSLFLNGNGVNSIPTLEIDQLALIKKLSHRTRLLLIQYNQLKQIVKPDKFLKSVWFLCIRLSPTIKLLLTMSFDGFLRTVFLSLARLCLL